MFYSQQGEDVYIHKNFVNTYASDGVFVEIGGFDGVTYSNTKFFEDTLGFKGVLIEPTIQYKLMVRNRPNCDNYNYAVAKTRGHIDFIGNGAVAGAIATLNPAIRTAYYPSGTPTYKVEAMPFKNILNMSNIHYIDILSIDVEGAELTVLETFDFAIPVYIIVIELHENEVQKCEMCRDILRENGFKLERRLTCNEFWVNKSYERKERLFDIRNTPSYACIEDVPNYHTIESHCRSEVFDSIR